MLQNSPNFNRTFSVLQKSVNQILIKKRGRETRHCVIKNLLATPVCATPLWAVSRFGNNIFHFKARLPNPDRRYKVWLKCTRCYARWILDRSANAADELQADVEMLEARKSGRRQRVFRIVLLIIAVLF